MKHELRIMALIDDGGANWGCYGPSLVPVLPQAPGGAQHPHATALPIMCREGCKTLPYHTRPCVVFLVCMYRALFLALYFLQAAPQGRI